MPSAASARSARSPSREQDARITTATRHYLPSRPFFAACFLAVVRAHWQIGSRLHWVLDVVLDDVVLDGVVLDDHRARGRKAHARENNRPDSIVAMALNGTNGR